MKLILKGGEIMENEQRWSWKDIDKKIVCPVPPVECKINEGIKRYRQTISHSTELFISECGSCEARGVSMGDPGDQPDNT